MTDSHRPSVAVSVSCFLPRSADKRRAGGDNSDEEGDHGSGEQQERQEAVTWGSTSAAQPQPLTSQVSRRSQGAVACSVFSLIYKVKQQQHGETPPITRHMFLVVLNYYC